MMSTVWAVVHEGRIEPLEPIQLTEGTRVLVTLLLGDEEPLFWLSASQSSLDKVWNNVEDDVYTELLKK